jgi:uncharacterized protein (DUF58 family)
MATLLTPERIGRLKGLDLVARSVVEGFITGLHRSPYHGFSVEFSEHRPYQPGDEIRHVDWRLFARSERFHIKQYEEETNLRCHVLLDGSASMSYASPGHLSKFEWGAALAACLMYLMVRQQDAAGLALFDEELRRLVPPRSTRAHLRVLLKELEGWRPSGGTRTEGVLHRLAETLTRRGLVVLISDLLDEESAVLRGLKHFRHQGHEVVVLQVLDPAELDFSRLDGGRFRDLESGAELSADPRLVAAEVNRQVEAFVRGLRTRCHGEGIDFATLSTGRAVDHALLEYLIKRKRVAG